MKVKFVIRALATRKQSIWIVGDCPQLGNWKFSNRIPLHSDGSGDGIWWCLVSSETGKTVHYRYLMCEELDGDKSVSVLRAWESGIEPRVFHPPDGPGILEVTQDDGTLNFDVAVSQVCVENATIDKGHLTGQTVVRLCFHNGLSYPIKLWAMGDEEMQQMSVKVMANYISAKDQVLPPPTVVVKVLSRSDCKFVDKQPPNGLSLGCREDEMLFFETETFHSDRLMFKILLFSTEKSNSNGPLGFSWLVPEQMKGSSGVVTVPLLGSSSAEPIGSMSVDFLKIMSFHHTNLDLSQPNRRYWNRHQKPLDIGHRGMGMSLSLDKFNKISTIPENTIHSLVSAGEHGADYIEFDVQLSCDKSLVVFHDLMVTFRLMGRENDELETLKLKVKDLTSEQLPKLKVGPDPVAVEGVPSKHLQFFPKLVEVFQMVPEHVGFYLDIKYTEPDLEDSESDFPYFDRNEYADLILDTLFSHAGSRPIVLASFDADMCTMLHLKQPRYSVLYLTCGVNDMWPVYRNVCQRTFDSSIAFAKSEQLLGISALSSLLLTDPSESKKILDSGLILFAWGDDNNEAGNIAKLKDAGVHAVVYDRIAELKAPV